jgi:hypothetical protein
MLAELGAPRHGARLPDDAAAFIADAERVTNTHALEEILAVYSAEPVLEMVTEGASARYDGRPAVRAAWTPLVDAFARERFAVRKTLIAATDGVIVNGWDGTTRRRTSMRGLEVWTFDDEALVARHLLHTFVDVRPADSWRARLRVLLASPGLGLSLAAAERRAAGGRSAP